MAQIFAASNVCDPRVDLKCRAETLTYVAGWQSACASCATAVVKRCGTEQCPRGLGMLKLLDQAH